MKLTLFEQCIQSLGLTAIILSNQESDKIEFILQRVFSFKVANIVWEKVEKKVIIHSNTYNDIMNILKNLSKKNLKDTEIYVIWDTNHNSIKINLDSAIANFDLIASVGTRTWLFSNDFDFIVEWHWTGNKIIGLASPDQIATGNKWKSFLDSIDQSLQILSTADSKKVFKLLKNQFGFKNLLVDWNIIVNQKSIQSARDILPILEGLLHHSFDQNIRLLNKNAKFPVLETNLELLILNWEKMLNLNENFWLLNKSSQYIIEVENNELCSNKILIGVPPINRNIQI